jgi:lipopolysaccharide/colanic/teichoic acid biosynthesis glycosyltransferase
MSDNGIIIALPRVGKDGRVFNVYKFRTMVAGAYRMQSLVYASYGLAVGGKFKDDPRVTPLGRFLRKYWIDEIPMIVNLVLGDIKLVGARPISPQYFSLYDDAVQQRRIRYRPGLIPPYYADMPATLAGVQQSEMRYFDAYDRSPVSTDLRYFMKIVMNILFKHTRSK